MRLLILTPEHEGSGGGIMTFYQNLVPALRTNGVEVRVIEGSAFHSARDRSVRWRDGVCVETLEADRIRGYYERFGHLAAVPVLRQHLAAAWAMWEQARLGEDIDVVEACDWGLLFVPPALDSTCPLLVQCHGSIGQIAQHDAIAGEETQNVLVRLLEGAVLAGVDTVQTYSRSNAAYWKEVLGRDVLMSRPAWAPKVLERRRAASGRGLVVARVQRWKGPQDLCAAIGLLGGRAPQIDWVGRDTPWRYRDDSMVTQLSRTYSAIWGKKIVHHSPIPTEEVQRNQASALFNLAPSTWDVFNFTAVEGMASGRPTIVSTGAGASELIEDGVNGYTFPSGDAEGLAAAIERVLSDSPARLADIGRAAQARVREMLNPADIAEQRLQVYRAMIDTHGKAQRPFVYRLLNEFCRPADHPAGDDTAFLDQVPIRTLSGHLAGRLGRKAGLRRRLRKGSR